MTQNQETQPPETITDPRLADAWGEIAQLRQQNEKMRKAIEAALETDIGTYNSISPMGRMMDILREALK